jgi:WD40 repeat protein
MFVWHAHEGAVTALAFGPDGNLVSAGSEAWCVKGWDPLTGTEQFRISLFPKSAGVDLPLTAAPRLLELSGDGCAAAVMSPILGLGFLDLTRERVIRSDPLDRVYALKRTPDGESVLVLGLWANPPTMPAIYCYDFASQIGSSLGLKGYTTNTRALAFSPDGTLVGVGDLQFAWPPVVNARHSSVYMKNYEPEDLAFSADNEHVFALVGGKVVVYSRTSGLYVTKLKGHTGKITAMKLAPDGHCLWTASHDATVKCWDTHSLSLDRTFRFDTGGLDCLAVSHDGNVAAVGSGQKGTITVWDLG